jgi:hypothetical protein
VIDDGLLDFSATPAQRLLLPSTHLLIGLVERQQERVVGDPFYFLGTAAVSRPIVRVPGDVADELTKPLIRLVSPAVRYSIEELLDVASVTIHRAGQFSSLRPPLVGIHRCGKGKHTDGRPTICSCV